MLSKATIALVAISMFMSVSALGAAKTGCNKFKFTGTFLSPSQSQGPIPDGTIHNFAYQLTLNGDGTANQYWTGLPDYLINLGTGSPAIGSWTCRDDGKLVLNLIQATYLPVSPDDEPLTSQDVKLFRTYRTTYLFSVDDDNTLTRFQARTRTYLPSQDPTDPAGGALGSLSSTVTVYKRFAASDADLSAL